MYALINSPDLKNLYCFWTLKYFFIVNRCVFLRRLSEVSHHLYDLCTYFIPTPVVDINFLSRFYSYMAKVWGNLVYNQ